MPRLTPETIELQDFGVVEVRETDLGGYTVTFLHVKRDVDMTQMFHGLPGDVCTSHHWGIVTDGRMTIRYSDHEEVMNTGDVFYLEPNHVPVYDVGTRLIFFSPAEEWRKVNETVEANARALQMG
jgi:hypothetical protein